MDEDSAPSSELRQLGGGPGHTGSGLSDLHQNLEAARYTSLPPETRLQRHEHIRGGRHNSLPPRMVTMRHASPIPSANDCQTVDGRVQIVPRSNALTCNIPKVTSHLAYSICIGTTI
jgi:hypothetical protein